jgi:enediyne polyketide synthase
VSGDRIAIVGMACRYPDAVTPEQLWQNVLARRRAFRRIPAVRLPAGYRGTRDEPDLAYVTHAAVLRDWEFDRERFGIPGPLFRSADLTHWLALETATDALADAGHPLGEGLDRDRVGVILGNSLTGEFTRAATIRLRWPFLADAAATAAADTGLAPDVAARLLHRLEALVKGPFPVPGEETLTGSLANTIAGRVCNQFDFHGTGYTVDGACSSSLLAVMTACRTLADGECDFVLAGGVDMSLDPLELVGFSRLGALAGDEMRVYDERPTGFLPGEGCGVVALMRAEDAERAGRRDYAHITGWASASDGSGGLSRPEQRGQVLALSRAHRRAGVDPREVGLIEGHGTGTAVGDRVELRALAEVRGSAARAALGSIKANIGHTKAAAGVAGLIKAALAVTHGVLPPTTGCARPHELLRDAPLRVLAEPEPWPSGRPVAGVSAMGFGGINAHLIIEGTAEAPLPVLSPAVRRWSTRIGPAEILYVGAASAPALTERLTGVSAAADRLSSAEIGDVAATAWRTADGTEQYRAALVAGTPEELARAARAAARAAAGWDGALRFSEQDGYALGSGRPARVGLLLPGQAAPVRHTPPLWAARLALPGCPTAAPGDEGTAVAQPAIAWQSLAALAWLRELGTTAVAACGHSLGELTALHWAGALSGTDLLALATERGRIMARHGVANTTMASVGASADDVTPLLTGTDVVIAAYNGPEQIVVSGLRPQVRIVVERARRTGVDATELPVSHGFHSPAMRPAREPLRAALGSFGEPGRVVVSTITGRQLPPGSAGLKELLVGQLTRPVLFADAVAELARRCDLLVEAGPGTILTGLAGLNKVPVPAVGIDSGGDPRRHALATAVLVVSAAADLDPWFAGRAFRRLSVDAEPRFVANPCEQREGWAAASELPAVATQPAPAAEPVADRSGDPLAVLTSHLAAELELPAGSIRPDSSLLGDLHLNSLQVVQLVGTVAAALGRRPPESPPAFAEATVADVAEVLAGLAAAESESWQPVPGVRQWVRPFEQRWTPFDPGPPESVGWTVRARSDHWLHELPATGGKRGLAVALPRDAEAAQIANLLREIDATRPQRLFLIHCGHPAAAGVGRSVSAELASCGVTVVEVPDEQYRLDPAALTGEAVYRELRPAQDGVLRQAVMAVRDRPPPGSDPVIPLGPGDVCLVTGGVRGITAYAAAELAERSGCTLVLAGRTRADDPDVVAALTALRERVPAHYVSHDIADAAGVVAASRRYGPIRGLVHGAGVNEPRRLADITAGSLADTLRPKLSGLLGLLGQLDGELRLVLGFSSIIGRQGLAGQAEYCVANDWLRVELERWGARHPECRTHVLEWSVWGELGMGARMDVLDTLRRQGVEPIPPALGAEALVSLMSDVDAPVTVLLTSRFPATPTLTLAQPRSWPRFAERAPVCVPGVEAVLDADLAIGSDPYLDDHRIDGLPVLPAVLGMEAMAQAAAIAGGLEPPLSVIGARFRAPIIVDRPEGRAIRTAALVDSGAADVVLSADADEFSARIAAAGPRPTVVAATRPITADDVHPWYGKLFFHGGRFRRLAGYEELSAFRVRAWLRPSTAERWFSQFHSGQLLLGDPAAHDATLHVLLACVPHRRALPVGVDRFTLWQQPSGPLLVDAREVAHTADDYEFDVDLALADGTVAARWQGLRLHAIGPLHWPHGLPARLVGPWLSRRLIESGIAGGIELVSGMTDGALSVTATGPVRVEVRTAGADAEELVVERSGSLTVTAVTPVLELPEPVAVTLTSGSQ